MGVAKQLYQLQEVDLELESSGQTLKQMVNQLSESQAVAKARSQLASEQQHLDELKRQQRSMEWGIDDLVTKITELEEQLYNGRIKSPKELVNLQHEVSVLKAKRDDLENKVLEIMGQVELTEANVAAARKEVDRVEADWQRQQKQLSADIEALKKKMSDLERKRQLLLAEIDSRVVEAYSRLRKQKGQAVVKVEQGICRGCRISLPFSMLQQVRGGSLVQCSSCGRILFLP